MKEQQLDTQDIQLNDFEYRLNFARYIGKENITIIVFATLIV